MPGWTVKDQLSHLVDYEARALGRPASGHEPGPLPHVKNKMGRANEVGVDARRAMSGAAVLDEFRQVTAGRLAQLRRLTHDDLATQTATPAGPATVADMLTLRLFATEQVGTIPAGDLRLLAGVIFGPARGRA